MNTKNIFVLMVFAIIIAAIAGGVVSAKEQQKEKIVISFNLGNADKKINENGLSLRGSVGRVGGVRIGGTRISSPKVPPKAPVKISSPSKANPVKPANKVGSAGESVDSVKPSNVGVLKNGVASQTATNIYSRRPTPLMPAYYGVRRFDSSSSPSFFNTWPPWYYWWMLGSHNSNSGASGLYNASYSGNYTK